MEYWDENDSDVDNDFSQDKCSDEPLTPNPGHESQENELNQDERSVIWWVGGCFHLCFSDLAFGVVQSYGMVTALVGQSVLFS